MASPLKGSLASGKGKSEWIVNPRKGVMVAALHPLTAATDHIIANPGILEELSPSLHSVDNWFQIIRRRVNMMERTITSATNRRRWNAYAGYNTKWMTKLLEIIRIYHNYCMTNENELKKAGASEIPPTTSAMRLGLVTEIHTVQDILNFNPYPPIRKKSSKKRRLNT